MNFCSSCGGSISIAIPEGDNRTRHICDDCGMIHYSNPKVVTGCIAHWEDKVLMARRAIEPRHGLWTVPAGFMENGETTYDGALRETVEEANARVNSPELYVIVNLPHINQIYMLYRGELADLDFSPGVESLDVLLMSKSEIPWHEMAFSTVSASLKLYFEDREKGHYPLHALDIVPDEKNKGQYIITTVQ